VSYLFGSGRREAKLLEDDSLPCRPPLSKADRVASASTEASACSSNSLSDSDETSSETAPNKSSYASQFGIDSYPVPVIVNNTFIDLQAGFGRDNSWHELVQERGMRSEPSSWAEQADVPSLLKSAAQLRSAANAPPASAGAALSAGSTLHDLGNCRPCAFFWKDEGCANDASCPFCHICMPGEKKRRYKERKEWFRSDGGGFFMNRQ
ncbi:unnamed protein product, partial [Polarella glacialis]